MPTLIIDGHPNPDSLCAALTAAYHRGNPDAELVSVRDLHFNPVLTRGLTAPQELEPDLAELRTQIEAATHLAIITPTWWASLPPDLKGVFDRVFTPGWAYRYNPMPLGLPGGAPEGLLTGRSARVLITSDTPRFLLAANGNHAARVLKNHILGFCGIKPVQVTRMGAVRWSTAQQRQQWLANAESLGARDARRHRAAVAV